MFIRLLYIGFSGVVLGTLIHTLGPHENGVHVLGMADGRILTTSTGESVNEKPANFQVYMLQKHHYMSICSSHFHSMSLLYLHKSYIIHILTIISCHIIRTHIYLKTGAYLER